MCVNVMLEDTCVIFSVTVDEFQKKLTDSSRILPWT